MRTVKLYQNEQEDMVAVVFEDGSCRNYITSPELAALDGDSFIEEARAGFPDAMNYDDDISETVSAEEAARREEAESSLIAEIGETVTLYPRRMGTYPQAFFRTELGDDLWQAMLAQADSPGAGVQVDL